LRLWSINPEYLDRAGLLAVWREALLAQKVLQGKTKGYTNHPQLKRFKNHRFPQRAIASYLSGIWKEAKRRGYNFDPEKIGAKGKVEKIQVTRGQLKYEFGLLREKLKRRAPVMARQLTSVKEIESHPLFEVIEGDIEEWERRFPDGRLLIEFKGRFA
jgi:hypothetical protein